MKEERGALSLLLEGVKRGEEAACRRLYLAWRPRVLRILGEFPELDADDREDLVQEIFTRAFRAVNTLQSAVSFDRWLASIVRNRSLSALSRKRAREELTQRYGTPRESVRLISESVRTELEISLVRRCIDELAEGPEKETVRLFYVEGGLSAQQIGERLGVGKSAVTMRLERFRARVRHRLRLQVLQLRWEP